MAKDGVCISVHVGGTLAVGSLCLLLLHSSVCGLSLEKQIIDSGTAEMFDLFHVTPRGDINVMAELDLLLTLDQFRRMHQPSERSKRKAVRSTAVRWTDAKVYFEITDRLQRREVVNVIQSAINEWEKFTCLTFEENKYKTNRIQFQDGEGCYSQLGMQNEPQPIVLARGCRTKGIIAHEIGHAIGWYHEHMRPDRDEYITINYNAIPMRYQANFMKYGADVVNTYGVPYDYTSIMHYGSDALPNSITTRDPLFQNQIGQRLGFTFKDIKLANLMYDCARKSGCKNVDCPNKGFIFGKEYKGEKRCQCWCNSDKVEDPLVLCSSATQEPTRPTLLPTDFPVTKLCYDVREDCHVMKEKGMCMTKLSVMMDDCAKTCDFCGKGETMCMDHDKGCAIMAAGKLCEEPVFGILMKQLCPASCGLCLNPPNPCEIQREMMGPGNGEGRQTRALGMLALASVCISFVLAI